MNKIYMLFIVATIAACTPSVQITATSTITPAPSTAPAATETVTSTPIPMIDVDGLKIPDPKASNPELFDLRYANSPIVQFIRAMSMIGVEVNEQQILDAMNDPSNYQTKTEIDGKPYVQFVYSVKKDEASFSFGLVYTQEEGWSSNFADILRVKSINFTSRAEAKGNEQRVALSTITEVRLELGDRELFNYESFDWSKVTNNWESVEKQLEQGTIPFENEVINRATLIDATSQMDFATTNNLSFAGDTLFYPSVLYKPSIKKLSPEDQIKVLKFMAAIRILKLDKMSKIDVASEVAAHRIWQTGDFEIPFNRLGGYEFVADLAMFAKKINPKLQLAISEAAIIDDVQGDNTHNRYFQMFVNMLKDLKQRQAPIELVKLQNEAWIGIPPTTETIETPVQEILALGYQIDAPDTIVAIGDTNPIWTNWPQTTEVSPDKAGKLLQQAEIYWLIYKVYLGKGVRNLGVHSLTDHEDWLKSESDLFTIEGNPKPAFFRVQNLILSY